MPSRQGLPLQGRTFVGSTSGGNDCTVCKTASNSVSGALVVQRVGALLHGSKRPCSQQIELGAAIHLTLNQLQLVVLALSLTIRPWQLQRGLDCRLVSYSVAGKGCHHAGRGIGNPVFKIGALSSLDELMEAIDEIAGDNKSRNRLRYNGHCPSSGCRFFQVAASTYKPPQSWIFSYCPRIG